MNINIYILYEKFINLTEYGKYSYFWIANSD